MPIGSRQVSYRLFTKRGGLRSDTSAWTRVQFGTDPARERAFIRSAA